MLLRQVAIFTLATCLAAACGAGRHALYQRLPEADKELFDRSRQFMTERQQGKFLRLPDSQARAAMIEGLHIAERLTKFEGYVRDAIMAQRIVPGMSTEAVLLSWGKPHEIDRRQRDGVESECWFYTRGDKSGKVMEKKVYFLRGIVTEVVP